MTIFVIYYMVYYWNINIGDKYVFVEKLLYDYIDLIFKGYKIKTKNGKNLSSVGGKKYKIRRRI